jgi:hypothetical protein
MKHKVFFWLLLKDRLSTRDLLQRQHLVLGSYTCDLCIRRKLKPWRIFSSGVILLRHLELNWRLGINLKASVSNFETAKRQARNPLLHGNHHSDDLGNLDD